MTSQHFERSLEVFGYLVRGACPDSRRLGIDEKRIYEELSVCLEKNIEPVVVLIENDLVRIGEVHRATFAEVRGAMLPELTVMPAAQGDLGAAIGR
jgi:hypothetical protein